MQKNLCRLLSLFLFVFTSLASFAQTAKTPVGNNAQTLAPKAPALTDASVDATAILLNSPVRVLQEDTPRPGSSGFFGYNPFWVYAGTGFLADVYWKDSLEFKTPQGKVKLTPEGTPYAIGGGVNVLSFLDLSVEYFKGRDYYVKGKKGDKYTYTLDNKKYTLTLDRDMKIKVLSYDVFSYGVQTGYTLGPVRFFGGLYQSTVTAKTDLEQVDKKKMTFHFLLPKLGLGFFIGNFFPYAVISLTDTIGVRYYF